MTRRQLSYLCVVLAVGYLLSVAAGIGYTNHVDQRQRADAAHAAAEREQGQAQTRAIVCKVALGQAEAFRDAATPAGRESRDNWLALAAQLHCEP